MCCVKKKVRGPIASTLQGPSPRSASHVSALGDALYVYGGYCKYAGDGDGDDGDVEKGVTHSDLWRLDLKSWAWERLKKQVRGWWSISIIPFVSFDHSRSHSSRVF